jgi:transposase-like protein
MPGVDLMSRARRSFSPEFKAQVVLDLLTGAASQAELCRKHNVKAPLLAYWRAAVLERLPSLFEADDHADQAQQRIAELEQLVGRQAYELEILKKASRLLTGRPSSDGRSS